jgi:hypothetical protein
MTQIFHFGYQGSYEVMVMFSALRCELGVEIDIRVSLTNISAHLVAVRLSGRKTGGPPRRKTVLSKSAIVNRNSPSKDTLTISSDTGSASHSFSRACRHFICSDISTPRRLRSRYTHRPPMTSPRYTDPSLQAVQQFRLTTDRAE